jgi:D-alanyl-lipoteichoic acid acyltransferase DltB (MBOAT superfamily)
LSLIWRRAGVDARPIMNAPALAGSLSDFWGRRWNLAFRDLSHRWVFRPLVGRSGIAMATMGVFVVSGVIHDLVISLSAGSGLGRPTLYFTLQGAALLLERSRAGKVIGLGGGIFGRAFTVLVVLAPVGLLFHTAFIERVVLPMLVHLSPV